MEDELVSKVWQIAGLVGKVVPGALILRKGFVAFITEEGIQFNVPLAAIKNIKWPILRMGMGFDAVIQDKKYKFSFAKPNPNAAEIDIVPGNPLPSVTFAGQYFEDISSLWNIKKDKAATKAWKEILGK